MKKRKLNNRLIVPLILAGMCLMILLLGMLYKNTRPEIIDQYVRGDDLYLVFKNKVSWSLDNETWNETDENNTFKLSADKNPDDLRIRNRLGYTYSNYSEIDASVLKDTEVNDSMIYLALNGKRSINYSYTGSDNPDISFSSNDESIATVNEEGVISGISKGQTSIKAKIGNTSYLIDVMVSDLIDPVTAEFNYDKPFISPGIYSKEDNDLLDEILVARVEEAGYQTRAGVVAAARFLALEFPYRIHYFVENGRIDSYVDLYCDGEGRYYHKGLYLHESRFANLDPELIKDTPAVWGDILVEYTNERIWPNGLDCSGFVSWCLLQGGYDPGDLGAGIAEWEDLSDLGPRTWLEDSISELRTGDLLAGGEDPIEGGHIGMVAGLKDGYIYVAESQGTSEYYWGYCIRKYTPEELTEYFFWRVNMASYYGEDGNISDYWLSE
jgi:hypothetical protein